MSPDLGLLKVLGLGLGTWFIARRIMDLGGAASGSLMMAAKF